MTRGLEATNGYNPLRIGWYDRLVSPGETTYMVDQRQFPASFDTYDCALARELGLGFYRALAANDHPAFIALLADLVKRARGRRP